MKYRKNYKKENLVENVGEVEEIKEICYIQESKERNVNKMIKKISIMKIRLVRRILLIFIILNVQIIISEYQNITLKIYGGLKQSVINPSYTKYIQEFYINDEIQTNIISTYNLTEKNNTIKLVFNSHLIDCSHMFKDCFNIYEIDFKDF